MLTRFTKLDFLDSQSSLALEDFQREWERARYGEVRRRRALFCFPLSTRPQNRLAVANNRVPKKVHILLSKRPKEEEEVVVEADGDDDDAFVREANKRAAPSRPEVCRGGEGRAQQRLTCGRQSVSR